MTKYQPKGGKKGSQPARAPDRRVSGSKPSLGTLRLKGQLRSALDRIDSLEHEITLLKNAIRSIEDQLSDMNLELLKTLKTVTTAVKDNLAIESPPPSDFDDS